MVPLQPENDTGVCRLNRNGSGKHRETSHGLPIVAIRCGAGVEIRIMLGCAVRRFRLRSGPERKRDS